MKILDALKQFNVAITHDRRWLFINGDTNEFVVLERRYRQKGAFTVYVGDSEEEAVRVLLGEE